MQTHEAQMRNSIGALLGASGKVTEIGFGLCSATLGARCVISGSIRRRSSTSPQDMARDGAKRIEAFFDDLSTLDPTKFPDLPISQG